MKNYIYPATLLCDFYKVTHREQYPAGTEKVYSTWIPRESRIKGINHVVAFGFQAFIKEYLIKYFNDNFFSRPKEEIVSEYKRVINRTLGADNPCTSHIEALHDLGYLPVKIKAVKEGSIIPLRVPILTIENTKKEFFWATNYLETLMSCSMWIPTTSATIGFEYRKILEKYAAETNEDTSIVQFQGHDFSMRGMAALEASKLSGLGHLLSFVGTDTIPAILAAEEYYNADIDNELIGTSIPATEHSVMCAHGKDEFEAYKKIITEVYPNGFVSIVSDTWDLWSVITKVIANLKTEILARNGKVVIRPDSGDPIKIVCGDPDSSNIFEQKGVIQLLWEIFGGTTTKKGFKQLDSHIGCIYGDAITLDRCKAICEGLKAKGFASTNMVYGIGSFTYQYNTRDTFGFALKSTHVVIDGQEFKIYKDPATDKNKVKKSLIGRVCVVNDNAGTYAVDNLSIAMQDACENDLLEEVFVDGKLVRDENFSDIRKRLLGNIQKV
jgi:nicotinamide phosphoribosyltransferase